MKGVVQNMILEHENAMRKLNTTFPAISYDRNFEEAIENKP